ncbi:MAG TPA: hypothetical protein P5137_10995, partial [Candidatus Brocadiia bacterium]|nr:hypothetical protein [Candidatus Brocadiia bacterium]
PAASETQPGGAAPAASAAAAPAPKPLPDNAPVTDLIRHIQQERQFNLVRAKEIADRQERLNVLRDEIERQKTELDNIRKALDERWAKLEKEKAEMEQKAIEIKAQEGRNLKQIGATYERMKPSAAAAALEALDVVTATKILAVMDTSKSGKIIEQMQPKNAAGITERLMKLRRESGAGGPTGSVN